MSPPGDGIGEGQLLQQLGMPLLRPAEKVQEQQEGRPQQEAQKDSQQHGLGEGAVHALQRRTQQQKPVPERKGEVGDGRLLHRVVIVKDALAALGEVGAKLIQRTVPLGYGAGEKVKDIFATRLRENDGAVRLYNGDAVGLVLGEPAGHKPLGVPPDESTQNGIVVAYDGHGVHQILGLVVQGEFLADRQYFGALEGLLHNGVSRHGKRIAVGEVERPVRLGQRQLVQGLPTGQIAQVGQPILPVRQVGAGLGRQVQVIKILFDPAGHRENGVLRIFQEILVGIRAHQVEYTQRIGRSTSDHGQTDQHQRGSGPGPGFVGNILHIQPPDP